MEPSDVKASACGADGNWCVGSDNKLQPLTKTAVTSKTRKRATLFGVSCALGNSMLAYKIH